MIDLPANDLLLRSANRRVRKLLSRAYLREDRLEEALEVYLELLADDAGDSYVLMVIGNLYRLAGSPATAARLYERALEQDPVHLMIQRQVAQARAEAAGHVRVDEVEPLSLPALMRLAQRLRSETERLRSETERLRNETEQLQGETEKLGSTGSPDLRMEIRAAADMLDKFMPEEQAGGPGADESVQRLMPALIEVNIRHARAAGRPDLAEALQSLQIHLRRTTGDAGYEGDARTG